MTNTNMKILMKNEHISIIGGSQPTCFCNYICKLCIDDSMTHVSQQHIMGFSMDQINDYCPFQLQL
jgi:hypothetical protein